MTLPKDKGGRISGGQVGCRGFSVEVALGRGFFRTYQRRGIMAYGSDFLEKVEISLAKTVKHPVPLRTYKRIEQCIHKSSFRCLAEFSRASACCALVLCAIDSNT